VDDTGFPKDGDHSVGVQRQYCGTLGKTANCQLGVSVNAMTERASCPLSWRLFLPESWDEDAERRTACHLPERVRHRPKWQLVLDMVDELDQWGLRPPVLVADAGYGEVGEFRQGLEDRQIGYVVQVKADTSAYPEQTRIEQDYRELKGALGLDHFEGRSWPGWHHHVTLVAVAHGFLTLERLGRPKPAASA
jgi:SRSO17 transposase